MRNATTLEIPGAELRVGIDNQLRTHDTQVYFFVLPLSIDPRNVYTENHKPGTTRVFVTVTPKDTGFVFRPSLALLNVARASVAGTAGFEFAMWDDQGVEVKEGSQWDHRRVGAALALTRPGHTYYLSIEFATPVPSPEAPDISIDLSQALESSQHPPVPLIRFAPVRWKEGYT